MSTTTLRSHHGTYLCAELNGTVGLRTEAGPWEQWTVTSVDRDVVTIQSHHGRYLCAEPDGRVTADREAAGPWEEWTVSRHETGIAFQSAHGRYLCLDDLGTLTADRTDVGPWEQWQVTLPPMGGMLDELSGQLRVDAATGYQDDFGPVLPVFCHAGDLFALYVRDPQRARQELDTITSAGYHGIRVWTALAGTYWDHMGRTVSPTLTPHYWDHWTAFVADVATRGLKLMVSQGDIGAFGSLAERLSAAARFAAIEQQQGGHPYAFFDAGNEAWQTGEPDPQRLAQFITAYKQAGGTAVCTLTSPPGEETAELNAFSIPPADAYDVHGFRDGHLWDKRRHIFSIDYEGTPRLAHGVQSEPAGPGSLVSVTAHQDELDDAGCALLAAASVTARQAWVYFSGEGVSIRAGLQTEPGFWTVPALVALLPDDLMSNQWTRHHSGTGWAMRRLFDQGISHEVRCDGAQHPDGRFVYTLDGPPGTHTFHVAKACTFECLDPGQPDAPAQVVRLQKGDHWITSWTRGTVLVGQLT